MREIVGLVLGAVAGAAGALFATSPEGRAMIQRLRAEARPEVDRATSEWEPLLNEVARGIRLAARELETATADFRARLAEVAVAQPELPAEPGAARASHEAAAGEAPIDAPARESEAAG
jgi:hypothetical protein